MDVEQFARKTVSHSVVDEIVQCIIWDACNRVCVPHSDRRCGKLKPTEDSGVFPLGSSVQFQTII